MKRFLYYTVFLCLLFLSTSVVGQITNYSFATLDIDVLVTNTCDGLDNGSLTFTVNAADGGVATIFAIPTVGGNPQLLNQDVNQGDSFVWDNGGAGLPSDTWELILSDASNAIITVSSPIFNGVTINSLPALLVNDVVTGSTSCVTPDGSISITITGGSGQYNYAMTGPNGFNQSGTNTSPIPIFFTNLDGGTYSLLVDDAFSDCSFMSDYVVTEPTITPFNVTPPVLNICDGDDATVSLDGSETGIEYTIQVNGTPEPTTTVTGNGSSINLTLSSGNFVDTDVLTVVGTAPFCPDVLMNGNSVIDLFPPTSIDVQPTPQTICEGDDASFSVTASGPSLTFQWQVDTGSGFGDILTETNSTLNLTAVPLADDGNIYRVIVSSPACPDVISDPALLTVNEQLVITVEPTDQQSCEGGDVTFSVTATGTNPSYQWFVDTGTGFVIIPGETNPILNLIGVQLTDNGNLYRVEVSSPTCPPVTSVDALLTVDQLVNIIDQPQSQTVCEGEDVTFSVNATASNPTYQWQVDDGGGGGFTDIVGEVNPTLTLLGVTVLLNGYQYRVIVGGDSCPDVTSSAATLTVETAPVFTLDPVDQTACEGDDVTFTSTATGSGFTYQWQVDTGSGFVDIPGETNQDLTLIAVTAGMDGNMYQVLALSADCPPVNSATAILNVNQNTVITDQPDPLVICEGGSAIFTVVATGNGLTYQWQEDSGSGFGDLIGEVSPSLALNPVPLTDNGNLYRVVISSPTCPDVTSSDALLTVDEAPVFTTDPVDENVCEGANVTFTSVATGTGVTYQWQVDDGGGGGFVDIPGETNQDLTLSGVTVAENGNQYQVLANSPNCPPATSAIASLTVNPGIVIDVQPVPAVECEGADVTFTVSATGTGLTYQWQVDTGSGFANIPTETSPSLTLLGVTPALNGNVYQVIIDDANPACPQVTSDPALLTVDTAPVFTTDPIDDTVCEGEDVTFTSVAIGTNITYQWQVDDGGGGGFVDISGESNSDLTLSNVTVALNGNQYRVIASAPNCPPATSLIATLTVNPGIVITDQPSPVLDCEGEDAIFMVVATGTGLTYQWQVDDGGGGGFVDIPGEINPTLTVTAITPAQNGNQYQVVIDDVNPACPAIPSDPALLTVETTPVFTTNPVDETVCEGENVTFTSVATGTGVTYQWQEDDLSGGGFIDLPGETNQDLTINSLTIASNGFQYRVIASSPVCPSATSAVATLTVNPGIVITDQPDPVLACESTDVTFSVMATGTGLTYQWQVDPGTGFVDIAGETNPDLMLLGVTTSQNGNIYRVVIDDANPLCPAIPSSTATLSVDTATVINTQPADQTVNVGEDATFMVDASGTNLTYQWQVSTDGGMSFGDLATATTETLVIGNAQLSQDGNLFQVIVQGDCGTNPIPNPATLTVIDNTPPDCSGFIVQVQDIRDTSCGTTDGGFTLNTNGSGTLPYTVEVFLDDGSTSPILTQSDTVVTGLAPNNYRYLITDTDGCFFGDDQIVVTEKQLVATVAGADANCAGETGTITITVTTGAGNYEYSLDQSNWTAFISGENIPIAPGTYDNIFIRDSTGEFCPTSDGPVTILEPSAFSVTVETALESVPERASGSILLRPVSGGVPYDEIGYWSSIVLQTPTAPSQYQPQTLVRDSVAGQFNEEQGVFQINFEDLFAGIYEITVFDSSQFCFTVLNVEVPLDTDLFIPNVFTPNQDGYNDFFFIRNLPEDEPTSLTIVNRWGRKVYSSSNYQNDWRAEDLSDGVYYYTVNVSGETLQGWVEVWRGTR